MLTKEELLGTPEYLLTKYQLEIFRLLSSYMEANNLTQKDIAAQWGVSSSYVSQVLNGNFNFTLRKLIELGLMVGKVPDIDFVPYGEYWMREEHGRDSSTKIVVTTNQFTQRLLIGNSSSYVMDGEEMESIINQGASASITTGRCGNNLN